MTETDSIVCSAFSTAPLMASKSAVTYCKSPVPLSIRAVCPLKSEETVPIQEPEREQQRVPLPILLQKSRKSAHGTLVTKTEFFLFAIVNI